MFSRSLGVLDHLFLEEMKIYACSCSNIAVGDWKGEECVVHTYAVIEDRIPSALKTMRWEANLLGIWTFVVRPDVDGWTDWFQQLINPEGLQSVHPMELSIDAWLPTQNTTHSQMESIVPGRELSARSMGQRTGYVDVFRVQGYFLSQPP